MEIERQRERERVREREINGYMEIERRQRYGV